MKLGALTGCHQMPERSFFIKGYQFPLCARCTGILVGELLALPLWMVYHPSVLVALFLIAPMAYDGIIQYRFLIMSNNRRRLVTGLLAGYGLMSFYIHIFVVIIQWVCKKIRLLWGLPAERTDGSRRSTPLPVAVYSFCHHPSWSS